jgi:hypothetical protein
MDCMNCFFPTAPENISPIARFTRFIVKSSYVNPPTYSTDHCDAHRPSCLWSRIGNCWSQNWWSGTPELSPNRLTRCHFNRVSPSPASLIFDAD